MCSVAGFLLEEWVVNLKELRQEVNAALDYNPDLAQYRDIVARMVNRHYLQISSQYQWTFLQKTQELKLRATIEGAAGKTVTVGSSDLRTVTFSGVTTASDWEGQTLIVTGSEFTITAVLSSSTCVVDTTFGAVVSAKTDWSIEFRQYPLPKDAVEILGIMSREDDRGRLLFLDRAREERLHLDKDETGDPIVYISMDSVIDPPPDDAPTTVAIAAGGDLEAETEYEFCYTFTYKGRESAPSLVSSATTGPAATSGGKQTIKISNLEDTQAKYGSPAATNVTGRLKRIYARKKTAGGVWREISGNIAESTTTFTWSGGFASSTSGEEEQQRVPTLFEQGPRQYLRAWYTASADLDVDIRYLQQPRRMSNDADVPAWPAAYHHLLVYRALQDISFQHGMTQMGQLYERRAAGVLDQMKARWLSSPDRLWIRRSFMKDMFQFERWGTPSKL